MKIAELRTGGYRLASIVDDDLEMECIIEVYQERGLFCVIESTFKEPDEITIIPQPDILHELTIDDWDYTILERWELT